MADAKFPECVDCMFFDIDSMKSALRCRKCDSGEFFEPKINDEAPDDNDLMKMFSRMRDDDQD